ncbi:Cas10/Cmr2 second palm domain-containing protein [Fontivita pretiosa]|uniref:Cas10/Cmr2 second palm domain-containing protein n=1 Tax=Fontivita pretiosa TaxID=2989684 RepID=UPI003D1752FC
MMFGLALSGLQDFIYELPDTWAARRLRIRSAILTLVPAVIGLRLVQRDPTATIHYLGGGKLLASGTEAAAKALERELQQIYSWLTGASGGRLGMYWASSDGNQGTAADLRSLLESLAQAKWKSGRTDRGFDKAGIRETDTSSGLGDQEWESERGAELARDHSIRGFVLGNSGWTIGNLRVRPVADDPEIGLAGRATARVNVSIPLYAPRDTDGSVAELFKLAEEAQGAPYLAILKLDGDRIGALLGQSLLEDPSGNTYRRTSGKLSQFFGQDVPAMLEKQYDRVYLVYSGGDDLVATGHFDMILRAARAIQQAYARLELGTVSAGVSFYTRNSPILKAVEAADAELENAKAIRDAISIGGCRLTWSAFDQLLVHVDGLTSAIQNQQINRGAIQLLRRLGEPWLNERTGDAAAQRWRSIPQLHYLRSRRDWKEQNWDPNLRALFDALCSGDHLWPQASLIGTLAGWKTKSRQEEP